MMSHLRKRLKAYLPVFLRRPLRAGLHYVQRIGRWGIILWQVKGQSISDEVKLLLSALASPVLSLQQLMSWQDPVLLFDTNVRVPGIGRFELRKYTDDLWHVLPWREKAIFQELHNRLNLNSTFVDAGANIGIYTVLASHLVGNNGAVIAFEMIPGTAKILQRHIELNGCYNVTVVEKALSDRSGEMVVATVPRGKFGQASIASHSQKKIGDQISIITTTLDEVCEDTAVIDLIKMDLEGVEALALSGAASALPKIRAIIFESVHDGPDDVSEIVENAGFYISDLTGKDQLALRV